MAEKEVTLWDDEETDSSHPGKTARTFGQAITAPAEGNSLISWRRGVQVSAAIIPGGESSGEGGDSGTGSTCVRCRAERFAPENGIVTG